MTKQERPVFEALVKASKIALRTLDALPKDSYGMQLDADLLRDALEEVEALRPVEPQRED